jgi:hypothetical protein
MTCNHTDIYNARLPGSLEPLGTVLLNRDQQIKHAFACNRSGLFAAGEVFNERVTQRLGIEPYDYIRLEICAQTRVH